MDGSFDKLEQEAGAVPYIIGEETFHKLFILVDGIYPQYSRFVKDIKQPIGVPEAKYSEWQEGARKDVERAFGNLKSAWQFAARPIHLHCIKDIAARMTTCLILHNMLVSDRVMKDPTKSYDPAASVVMEEATVEQPADLRQVQNQFSPEYETTDTTTNNQKTESVKNLIVSRRDRWLSLSDTGEHARLYAALLKMKGSNDSTLSDN
jgi:hypothetical protein